MRPIRSKDHILAELRNKLLSYFAAVKPLLSDPPDATSLGTETILKGKILSEKFSPESVRSDPIDRVMELFDVVNVFVVKEAQIDLTAARCVVCISNAA